MTLSMIITLLIEEFLPEMYQKYQFENFQMSKDYRAYNQFVPDFLQGRPHKVIRHCMDRKLKAKIFSLENISDIDACSGQFYVSNSSGKLYKVNFGSENEMPSCECKDWIRFNLPCKHFFAVFNNKQQWKWDSLPVSYLKSAYLSQDSEALVDVADGDVEQESQMEGRDSDAATYDAFPAKVS